MTVTALDASNAVVTTYSGTVHFTSSDGQASSGNGLPANYTFVGGDSGSHTFTSGVTLKTAGTQTVTATDVSTSSINGHATVSVSPGAEAGFVVTAPGSATVGVSFSLTVTAKDAFGNTFNDNQTLYFSSATDPQAVFPTNCVDSLVNGVGSANITLKTVGSQTVTAHGCSFGYSSTSGTITVSPGVVTHYAVAAPGGATAGVAFGVIVTAEDTGNNTVPSYSGTVQITSSDGQAVLPPNSTLTSGTKTFIVTLGTAGTQTVTATDTLNSNLTNMSNNITVTGAAATHLGVSAPASVSAGSGFSITVTAQDQFGNTDPNYSGTVHFISSDALAVLPGNSSLSSGVGTFPVTLKTGGSQSITARDTVTSSITGKATVTVTAGGEAGFAVSAPASVIAGGAFTVTVTAKDSYGNTVTTDNQPVYFTSSDGQAVLPTNCVDSLINGVGTASITLKTLGSQTVTAHPCSFGVSGTSGTIAVNPAVVTHFAVSAPSTATAGTPFNIIVTAQDAANNTVAGYAGTVQITSSDAQAGLPANSTLTNGSGIFSVTLKTAGTQTVTATDTVNSGLTGTGSGVNVSAILGTHFSLSAPANANPGAMFTFTVTALDPYGNTATSYSGTVHFTSSDVLAVLPANSALASGVGTFNATLSTAGAQTITATDVANSNISGTSASISVASLNFTLGLSHLPARFAAIGGRLTFTSKVTNNSGGTVANVTSTITLNGDYYIVSTTTNVGSCTGSGKGPVSCNLGTMSNLQAATITVTVTPVWPASTIAAQASANVTTNTKGDTAVVVPKPFVN